MKRLAILAIALGLAGSAHARDTERTYPIQAAVQSPLGRERLHEVPFFFSGQEHPGIGEQLSTVRTEQTTSGVFRSDRRACGIALLSALRQLQVMAREEHADAIVDIVSVSGEDRLESASEFRCVAGATVAHVKLVGKLVRFAK